MGRKKEKKSQKWYTEKSRNKHAHKSLTIIQTSQSGKWNVDSWWHIFSGDWLTNWMQVVQKKTEQRLEVQLRGRNQG